MQRFALACAAMLILVAPSAAPAQQGAGGQYRVLKTLKAGGEGGFDYVYADADARRLYITRRGPGARITVWDLDTLAPVGEVPNTDAHGVVVDEKSGHAFASSRPVLMFDPKTLQPIKRIDVQGDPDTLFFDPDNQRVYVMSRRAPNVTAIDSKDGTVLGTIDIGGAAEEMRSDGRGHLYVVVQNKHNLAVIDAKSMKVTAHYELQSQGGTCNGLAMDTRTRLLFATCRKPNNMVILNADSGKIVSTMPIGSGSDGAAFNPATGEAFSSQTDGTLTVVRENSPNQFRIEQTVRTMPFAKTMTLDSKTNHLILIAAQYEQESDGQRGPMIPGSFTILEVGK